MLIDGRLLTGAAAALAIDACDTPDCVTPEAVVDGVGMLRVLNEELLLCLRDGVGCVAPVNW